MSCHLQSHAPIPHPLHQGRVDSDRHPAHESLFLLRWAYVMIGGGGCPVAAAAHSRRRLSPFNGGIRQWLRDFHAQDGTGRARMPSESKIILQSVWINPHRPLCGVASASPLDRATCRADERGGAPGPDLSVILSTRFSVPRSPSHREISFNMAKGTHFH